MLKILAILILQKATGRFRFCCRSKIRQTWNHKEFLSYLINQQKTMIKLTNIYSKGHIVVISSIQRLRIIRFFFQVFESVFLAGPRFELQESLQTSFNLIYSSFIHLIHTSFQLIYSIFN